MIKEKIDISKISKTLLITIYARAIESQSENSTFKDPKSVEIVNKLDSYISKYNDPFYQRLIKRNLPKSLSQLVVLRNKLFDKYVMDFTKNNPDGVIINIGCGLATRFFRVENGQISWYDLDFPEVIDIKKQFVQETDRYHFLATSVFNYEWIKRIDKNKKILLIGEGVFIFLNGKDVKDLLLKLQSEFPGCEIVFDVNNIHLVTWQKLLYKVFFRHLNKNDLTYSDILDYIWGIRNEYELEKINPGITFIDKRVYADYRKNKNLWYKIKCCFKFYRETQYIVHYKLN